MHLTNKMYDASKWFVLVFLPACAVLAGGLGELYVWPDTTLAVTTINLTAVFLGSILQISSHHYHNTPKGGGHVA